MRRLSPARLPICFLALLLVSSGRALPGQGLPAVKPEQAGMSSARLDKLTDTMQGLVDRQKASGVVTLIAHQGKVVYLSAVGKRDGANRPMTPDTLFRIASMTKPITSVAIMMLYEEGKLQLKDPLSKYIPEFKQTRVLVQGESAATAGAPATEPMQREIAIEDLLCHRSGLTYSFIPSTVADAYKKAGVKESGFDESPVTLAENMRKLAAQPLLFQPGARWNYGLSVDVLGRVVEVVSGKTLEQFCRDRIFKPLKMTDACFYVSDDRLNRLAAVYSPAAGKLAAMPRPLRGSRTYFSGGAGLICTAGDYARFLQMLLNGGELDGARLLKPATVRLMTVSHTDDLPGIKFCLGFARDPAPHPAGSQGSPAYCYSWGGIFGTQFFWDPKNDLAGVAMVQLFPAAPTDEELSGSLRTAAYEALASVAGLAK